MLVQDLVFLVIIVLGEGLIDEYGAGRSGRPFADKEILYRERGNEPVIPGSKARLFGHGDGGRGGEKVEVGSRFVMYLRGTLADEPLASRERRTGSRSETITHSAPGPDIIALTHPTPTQPERSTQHTLRSCIASINSNVKERDQGNQRIN